MKSAVIVVFASLLVSIKLPSQTIYDKVTIQVKNVEFEDVLDEITKQTGYCFNYDRKILVLMGKVTLYVRNKKVKTVLEQCFKRKPLICEFDPPIITIKKRIIETTLSARQQIKIPFDALNEEGESMQDVDIKFEDNSKITYSKVKGNNLFLPDSNVRIIVSASGYHKIDTAIKVKDQIEPLVLFMKLSSTPLDAIVKLGYGKTTRRLNTSNVTKVTARELGNQFWNGFPSVLSGRVPGLLVTQMNGLPSSFFKTQVQGQSSIGTKRGRLPFNDPLYVIDGVPFAANNNSLQVLSSGSALGPYGRSPLVHIDPNNIESVEVLKDADGTAIYGSRGAKGVVLITSKRGKPEGLSISIDVQNGIGTPTRRPKMLNTEQYIQLRREALKNDKQTASLINDKDLLILDANQYTDFYKELLGNSAKSKYAGISVSSGLKNIHYFVNANYHKETTVFPGKLGENRGNLHVALAYNSSNKKLSTLLSANYSSNTTSLILSDLTAGLALPPNSPPLFDSTGKLNWGQLNYPYSNPLALLHQDYHARTVNMLCSYFMNFSVVRNLNFKTTIGYNRIWSSEMSITPIKSFNPYNSADTGTAYFGKCIYKSLIVEPHLEYHQHFGNGKLTVLVGSSFQKVINNNSRYTASGYTDDDNYFDSTIAESISYPEPLENSYSYKAIFGRLNYNWLDKYIMNFTTRIEASNRLGWTSRTGHFDAIGVGWIFTNESFVKDISKILTFGKVRASLGNTGNDPIGDYQYFDGLSRNISSSGNNTNSLLEWERTRKLNFGLELGFLKDFVYVSVDYFLNRSTNQLVSMPDQNGSNRFYVTNWPAIVQNSGLEFVLQFKSQDSKKINWSSNLVLTIPRNKLVSFPNLERSPYSLIFKQRESLTMQQGYHSLGVDPAHGIYQFEDKNGDQKLSFPEDYSVFGHMDPTAYGGFIFNLSFKNWRFCSLLEGRIQQGYSYIYKIYKTAPPGTAMVNQPSEVLNRWQQPGDKAVFQLYTTGNNPLANEAHERMSQSNMRFVDASFIRIKNINLTYILPSKWLLNWHLKSASLNIQATNAAVITKYKLMDPETQELTSLPPLRTIVFGLHLDF